MNRRAVIAAVVCTVAAVGCNRGHDTAPATTTTQAPTGGLPVDRLVFDSDRTGNFELFTTGRDGARTTQVTNDRRFDSWSPRLSPDRHTILFHRTPAGTHDLDPGAVSLWTVGVDGTGLTLLRDRGTDGWDVQGHAEWSPDGTQLVMFGGRQINPQIMVTDNHGQHPHPVTNRGGTNIDPVFSPDGKRILFVGCPSPVCVESQYEIFEVDTRGRNEHRLTDDNLRDHDPALTPDGRTLAWLTQITPGDPGVWVIRTARPDGTEPARVGTDAGVTSRPEFAADGTLFTHRMPPGANRFGVYTMGLDGSSREVTAGQPGNNEYPSP